MNRLQKTSVLVVDDSKTARKGVIDTLKKKALFQEYLEAENGHMALKTAIDRKVDLILCDISMPRADGFAFLKLAQSCEQLDDVPIIMLTVKADQTARNLGLNLGAFDYVTKPYHPQELIARVKINLRTRHLVKRLKQSNRSLEEVAHRDPLTRIANERGLLDVLRKEIKRSNRQGTSFSLALVQIDSEGTLPVTADRNQASPVLPSIAETIAQNLRPYDASARCEDRIFALVLPETSIDQGVGIVHRLNEALTHIQPPSPLAEYNIRPSSGMVNLAPEKTSITKAEELLAAAQSSLEIAKQKGSGNVEAVSI